MHIFEDDILYGMTLIAAVHNGKDLVVGSDTLVTKTENGQQMPDEIWEKIIPLNPKTAILFTGNIGSKALQLLKEFAYNHSSDTDPTVLKNMFLGNVAATLPPLREQEKVQICIVGFKDKQPSIEIVTLKPNQAPISGHVEGNYFIGGFENPSKRMLSLLEEKGLNDNLRTVELKKVITDILKQCIDEFSTDKNGERLGGNADIRVLHGK